MESLDYFRDRFVEIEGDTIQCVECVAINVNSIEISDSCASPVYCYVDPCVVNECNSYPNAECIPNYCDGCWADFYLNGDLVDCGSTRDCIDLSGIDFGHCDMVLGIGWVNDSCMSISGCDWTVDSVDYTSAFFYSMDACVEACDFVSIEAINHLPQTFHLYDNIPNPFNPNTIIHYDLQKNVHVQIMIYDVLGREVRLLVNHLENAGLKSVVWDATNNFGQPVSAGMYLYRISAGNFHSVKKMILLK
jgi:hypothetical protein